MLRNKKNTSKTYKTRQEFKLENVAIANVLQLEATRVTAAFFRFNYNAMPSLTSLNLSNIIAFLLLIHYFTPWLWPLTLWPWPLTF